MRLRKIKEVMKINVTAERMWEILSNYGDVAKFHAGVDNSYKEQGSDNQAAMGCERVCHLVDMGLNITLKERIVNYFEGDSYTYEVYEWKNFPLRKMLFGFQILRTDSDYIKLVVEIQYKLKPAFLTPLMAGKMRRLARTVLLGYRHYAETGESRVPIKELKQVYKERLQLETQYG